MAAMGGQEPATQRMAVAAPFVALTYVVLLLLYEVLLALSGAEGLGFRTVFFVPFILIFAASAMGVASLAASYFSRRHLVRSLKGGVS